MSTLNKIRPKVEYLLKTEPKLRDDDFCLVAAVYHRYYGVEHGDSFLDVMRHHEERGLPSFETIRRTRQKVQEENPLLESSKAKKKERQMAFNEFYEFAKGCRS